MASTYTWSLQSGSLPPGLSLDTGATDLSSAITGTPTTSGSYSFTVRCTNDVSGSFDDQAYTMEIISGVIEMTPDLGTSTDSQFSASNPFLVGISDSDLTLDASLNTIGKYSTSRKVTLQVDIGAGSNNYWFNLTEVKPNMPINRWYLWRLSTDPDDIKRVFIV